MTTIEAPTAQPSLSLIVLQSRDAVVSKEFYRTVGQAVPD